mgnify:CR=1 FL=1
MEEYRKIRLITEGRPAVDGAGVRLVRVFGYRETKLYDPFLLFDAFDSENPEDYVKGFPWHPHRGIETITYLIDGAFEHGDSLGNGGLITKGGCQWMTAGSGIIHQEMPKPSARLLGAQLWLNIPQRDKMCQPKYGDIRCEDVPIIEFVGGRLHIIAGNYLGTEGAFAGDYVKATYFDVELDPDATWQYASPKTDTLFIYVVSGGAETIEAKTVSARTAVLFTEGNHLYLKAKASGIRFLVLTAPALNEPIAWGGPIVMNTKEELDLAFRELQENTFLKYQPR